MYQENHCSMCLGFNFFYWQVRNLVKSQFFKIVITVDFNCKETYFSLNEQQDIKR